MCKVAVSPSRGLKLVRCETLATTLGLLFRSIGGLPGREHRRSVKLPLAASPAQPSGDLARVLHDHNVVGANIPRLHARVPVPRDNVPIAWLEPAQLCLGQHRSQFIDCTGLRDFTLEQPLPRASIGAGRWDASCANHLTSRFPGQRSPRCSSWQRVPAHSLPPASPAP